MKTKNRNLTKILVESSLMIAFATVLSLIKLAEMPYGGSITLASMTPIAFIAYRHGTGAGLSAGVVYAALQQLLGLNSLSYVTGWQSVVAVILLDYVLAFTVVGFAGVFKGKFSADKMEVRSNRQKAELGTGMAFVCVLRYILHTVAGATVWAGLSIPTEAALIYSIGYNATYMIPETIVNVLFAVWLGGIIDFSRDVPVRFAPGDEQTSSNDSTMALLRSMAVLLLFLVVVADAAMIFPHIQHPDDGRFTFELLGNVKWAWVIVISAAGALFSLAIALVGKNRFKKNEQTKADS